MEGDLRLDGEHTTQYTDNVLLNCRLEAHIILLTSVTQKIKLKNSFISSFSLVYVEISFRKK